MSDGEDDFVTYGTALDPLDEDNLPRKKPVAIEDQCAYDAQGRRRFHGAFTGGFSAGYFNSVGTPDGWRPQQFKSTRSSKASNVVQQPEDFMDDEDTGQFGIAPTAIRATKEYSNQANKGLKRERAKNDGTEPIPGTPVLKELLKPVRERVGVMLLKKMGWKPGQGVGPRLTKKEKKQKKKQCEKVKIYGCLLPNQADKESESESEFSDDEFVNITFAPDDYEPFRCNPKDNYFGIGYSGLDRHPVLSQHVNLFDAPTFKIQEKNKNLSIRGQAFGVGAFEAEDDDIYANEDMSRYDFALGPERKTKSRWQEEKKKTDCIEGFVPGKEQLPQKKIFEVPVLPKDFQPAHKVRKSRFSPLAEDENVRRQRYEMNAESRAKIINDDRPSIIDSKKAEPKNNTAVNMITRTLNLHGKEQVAERQKLEQSMPKKSAMSWLDKLSSTTFIRGETIGNDPKIQGSLQDVKFFLKESDKPESNKMKQINVMKPTFADLEKQRRFEEYLKFSESERKLKFPTIQPLSMADWERDQEAAEFEKAARLCESLDKASVNEAEQKTGKEGTNEKIDLESLNTEDKMVAAAKMKMFGKLTRTDTEWKPAKLVCVRFNIAEPFVEVPVEDKKKKKFSIFDSLAWNEMSKFEKAVESDFEPRPSTSSRFSFADEETDSRIEHTSKESLPKIISKSASKKEKVFEDSYEKVFGKSAEMSESTETFEVKETEVEVNTPLEPVAKANVQEKKDLFKSIFLSSSEESESETEESNTLDEEKLKAALIGKSAAEQNVQRNTSPPRGIFAKLDLDSLMKRPNKMEVPKEVKADKEDKADEVKETDIKTEKQNIEVKMEEDVLPPDVYGPALPKTLPQANDTLNQKPVSTGSSNKASELDKWVEKPKDKKKSKKEKKKHKHKERSRSKNRKKSKKEKRH